MKWNKIEISMPDKTHADLRTEFLVRGNYKVDGKIGDTCHRVCRLMRFTPKSFPALFEIPMHFYPTHWAEIKEIKP